MKHFLPAFLVLSAAAGLTACSSTAPPPLFVSRRAPGPEVRQQISRKVSAIVVTSRREIKRWRHDRFSANEQPGDVDGGSATPVTADGYFLTADHVLEHMGGRRVFVIYGPNGRSAPARVVWRSAAGDIAILHAPLSTPDYYEWTPADKWLPAGSVVTHGGIATSRQGSYGKLATTIAPDSAWSGTRHFKIDLPLQPGDSGGPVLDAKGRLIGINSAVEFVVPLETAFFVDSEGNRPNVGQIMRLIDRDRETRHHR